MSRNDITGDNITSKVLSAQGRDNWDNIFRKKEVSGYKLFLDDVRNPSAATIDGVQLSIVSGIKCADWTVVRSYVDFVSLVTNAGIPSVVSFDHDLCDEHVNQYLTQSMDSGAFDYHASRVKTGYHCAIWLKSHCDGKGLPYPKVYSHSFNHIGKQNILSLYGNDN